MLCMMKGFDVVEAAGSWKKRRGQSRSWMKRRREGEGRGKRGREGEEEGEEEKEKKRRGVSKEGNASPAGPPAEDSPEKESEDEWRRPRRSC